MNFNTYFLHKPVTGAWLTWPAISDPYRREMLYPCQSLLVGSGLMIRKCVIFIEVQPQSTRFECIANACCNPTNRRLTVESRHINHSNCAPTQCSCNMLQPQDTYTRRMSPLKFGLPLFSPCNVQLGDVGFINRANGSFQLLFNIAEPDTSILGHPPPVNLVSTKPDLTEWQAIHVCFYFWTHSIKTSIFIHSACRCVDNQSAELMCTYNLLDPAFLLDDKSTFLI